jgi:secretion/DNA translocation related TadE-like protein
MNERGAGSLLVLMAATVLTGLAICISCVASAVIARAQVQQSADLVALSSAPLHEDPPCQVAQRVALANNVSLLSCTWSEGRSDVTVSRPFAGPIVDVITARARAEVVLPLPASPLPGVMPSASPIKGVLPSASPIKGVLPSASP